MRWHYIEKEKPCKEMVCLIRDEQRSYYFTAKYKVYNDEYCWCNEDLGVILHVGKGQLWILIDEIEKETKK